MCSSWARPSSEAHNLTADALRGDAQRLPVQRGRVRGRNIGFAVSTRGDILPASTARKYRNSRAESWQAQPSCTYRTMGLRESKNVCHIAQIPAYVATTVTSEPAPLRLSQRLPSRGQERQ